jgi:hypothetical protein
MSTARSNAQRNSLDFEFPDSEPNYSSIYSNYSRASAIVSRFVIAVDLLIDDVESIETGYLSQC